MFLTQLRSTTLQAWADEANGDARRARSPECNRLRTDGLEVNEPNNGIVRLIVARATEISPLMHELIYELVQNNMKSMYEQLVGWDASAKRAELEHHSSRFLLALQGDADGSYRRLSRRRGMTSTPVLLGFVMFRYDTDETVADDPCADAGDDCVEVAYWQVFCAH